MAALVVVQVLSHPPALAHGDDQPQAKMHRIDNLISLALTEDQKVGVSSARMRLGVKADNLRSHLLVAFPSFVIPDGKVVATTLYLYVDELSDDTSGEFEVRGYRLRDAIVGTTLRGGWFIGSNSPANGTSWDRRGFDPQNANQSLQWPGLPGGSREGVDFTSWSDGDPALSLAPSTPPGYRAISIPPAWIEHWHDVGENRGILFKLRDEVHRSSSAVVELSAGPHPPFAEIFVLPATPRAVRTRVIANDGIVNATWPLNGSKVASRSALSFVAYTRQDRHWTTLWRDADGSWHPGWTSKDETPETPLLLMDADGFLHVFANEPDTLMLRHYRSSKPLSVESFDDGEDVVAGPSHFGGTIGPDGTIYVAYLENGTYDIKIAVNRPDKPQWNMIRVVEGDCRIGPERCGHYPSIRVDAHNDIHLTYDIVRLKDYVHTLVGYTVGVDHGRRWYRSDGAPQETPIRSGYDEAINTPDESYLQGGQILISHCGKVHILYHRRRIDAQLKVSSSQEVVDARRESDGWKRTVIGEGGSNNTGVLVSDSTGKLYAIFDGGGQIVSYQSSDDGLSWENPLVLATRPRTWPQTATLWFPSTQPMLEPGEPIEVIFTGIHEYGEIFFSNVRPAENGPGRTTEITAQSAACGAH